MERLDADRWFHPSEQSLLTLAAVRAEEETLLDEHFRSLPPIIQFSNERWYDGDLRIMTDERQKRFGRPDQAVIQLHHVPTAVVSNGSQENEEEARALVDFLSQMVVDPDYHAASIGVMCLFEEQVPLVQDLVAERIPAEQWERHDLVVINPDGFQGDERDVILYSLSYDAKEMPQAALSARMSAQAHVQGMLNVAFTRARDEMHIFHSAPIDAFTFADGSPGTLTDWLRHCAQVAATPRGASAGSRLGNVDSEFEGDVAAALRGRGLRILHQYPACGFHIDLLAEREVSGARLAIECDGERDHLDEHGLLRTEDIERQAILERAGWRVIRIPYRKWLANPAAEVARVIATLDQMALEEAYEPDDDVPEGEADETPSPATEQNVPIAAHTPVPGTNPARGKVEQLTPEQAALLDVLKADRSDGQDIFLLARDRIEGWKNLSMPRRSALQSALLDLEQRKLVAKEDGEYFVLPAGRDAVRVIRAPTRIGQGRGYRGRSRRWR